MFTAFTVKGKFDGKPVIVATEQYLCGLYVAVYWPGKSIPDQDGYREITQEQFHRDVRDGKVFTFPVTVITEKSTPLPAT